MTSKALLYFQLLKYYVQYTKNLSLLSDTTIILATVIGVLKKEGISSQTSATMEVFSCNHKIYE